MLHARASAFRLTTHPRRPTGGSWPCVERARSPACSENLRTATKAVPAGARRGMRAVRGAIGRSSHCNRCRRSRPASDRVRAAAAHAIATAGKRPGCRDPWRRRAAIEQPLLAFKAVAGQPFRDRANAHAGGRSGLRQRPVQLLDPSYDQQAATRAGPRVTVDLHPVLLGAEGVSTPSIQGGPDGTTCLRLTSRPCAVDDRPEGGECLGSAVNR